MTFYERLRRLLDWRAEPGTQVVSLHLDLGESAERLVDEVQGWAQEAIDRDELADEAATRALLDDALPAEIRAAQAQGHAGLAVFFCASPPLNEMFRLRFHLEPGFEVNHEPQTWQLVYHEEEYEQALAVTLGERPEIVELHVGDVAGRHLLRPSHGRSREQELRSELHLLLHDSPRAHLLLLGPPDERARLLASVEPALRARLIGEHDVALGPDSPDYLLTVHRLQQAYERRAEAAGVRSLLDARAQASDGQPVAAGTTEVIDAINQGFVQKLYMLQGFDAPGWVCDACDRLGLLPSPPACTACGASVARVPLRHHLLQQARACGAEIETVYESADLREQLGGVAAELLPR